MEVCSTDALAVSLPYESLLLLLLLLQRATGRYAAQQARAAEKKRKREEAKRKKKEDELDENDVVKLKTLDRKDVDKPGNKMAMSTLGPNGPKGSISS